MVYGSPLSEDLTIDFINYITVNFQNYSVDRGLTSIEDHTSKPLGGVRIGYEVRARGNAQIQGLVYYTGQVFKVSNIPNLSRPLWSIDALVMVFSFISSTQAESWTVPGGAIVDYPWRSLTPTGQIRYILRTVTIASLELNEIVFETANDRPNNFVKNYVTPLFTPKLKNIIETYTGINIS